MKILIVIPARYASTRLPGKPLADIGGKPMVQHVYERALRANLPNSRVVVAADDLRVVNVCRKFGADVVMTSKKAKSGSDRAAEAAKKLNGYSIVVNVQGDEPLIDPQNIRLAVKCLLSAGTPVATLVTPLDPKQALDPNVVKAAVSRDRALYFSRLPVPYNRDRKTAGQYKHLGLYVYRRDFLIKFTKLKQTPLEKTEKLEQLRILENGYEIAVAVTRRDCPGVDTPADLNKIRNFMKKKLFLPQRRRGG